MLVSTRGEDCLAMPKAKARLQGIRVRLPGREVKLTPPDNATCRAAAAAASAHGRPGRRGLLVALACSTGRRRWRRLAGKESAQLARAGQQLRSVGPLVCCTALLLQLLLPLLLGATQKREIKRRNKNFFN